MEKTVVMVDKDKSEKKAGAFLVLPKETDGVQTKYLRSS